MEDPPRDNPGVLVFPPVLVAGTLVFGLVLHWLRPWRLPLAFPWRLLIAVPLLILALALGLWGERSMHGSGTNVNPGLPTTAIVSAGPFRFSRNPLYLCLIGSFVAVTLAVGTIWPFILLVPMFLVLHFGVVRREERYLEAKFGDAYRAYKGQVRRWV